MKINLYNSMFRSHLEYGILAWGGVSGNKTKGIFNLQKKCIRNVAGKKRSSHTDPLFSQLKILKFSDLFKMNCLNFMHNFAFGRQPQSFNNMFTPLGVQNRTGNYQITKYKSNFFDKFTSAFLPEIWNENCGDIKHCTSSTSPKQQISIIMSSNYNLVEHCNYLGCQTVDINFHK